MFFELQQISKLSSTIESLQKNRQKLHTIVIDAYQSEPQVKNSLNSIINEILETSDKRMELFNKIEEDSMHGFLVPSYIDFDELSRDKGELPEWTRTIFQKEFQKQKQTLDIMAKKIYSSQMLTDARNKHERQFNSFKMLAGRYEKLSEYQETIDIMSQAQKMKNFTRMTGEKFMAFLNVVASKLVAFFDDMTAKCQYFGQDLNQIANKSVNSIVYHEQQHQQPPVRKGQYETRTTYGSQNKTGQNWLTRANRTLDRTQFRGNPQNYLLRQPKWLSTFSSDYYV